MRHSLVNKFKRIYFSLPEQGPDQCWATGSQCHRVSSISTCMFRLCCVCVCVLAAESATTFCKNTSVICQFYVIMQLLSYHCWLKLVLIISLIEDRFPQSQMAACFPCGPWGLSSAVWGGEERCTCNVDCRTHFIHGTFTFHPLAHL